MRCMRVYVSRHLDRNDQIAKAWLNSAIATASLLPDPSERAFQSAFYKNGLALVVGHRDT